MDAIALAQRQPLVGLQVEVVDTLGGAIELAPLPDHRIRVHSGPPVRGTCGPAKFTYRRGDVDIIAPGQADRWHEEGPGRSLVLRFAPALLRRTAHELGLREGLAGLAPRHQFRDPQISHIAWALQAEQEAGSPNGRLVAQSLASALCTHLLGRHAMARREPRGLAASLLKKVCAHIEERLDSDLSLPELAGLAHSSPSHFKTLFKRSTGLPVHEYVVQRRVRRARDLLLQGRLPASQVALAAGFSHQSHMARSMRRVLGVTPAMLRAGGAP